MTKQNKSPKLLTTVLTENKISLEMTMTTSGHIKISEGAAEKIVKNIIEMQKKEPIVETEIYKLSILFYVCHESGERVTVQSLLKTYPTDGLMTGPKLKRQKIKKQEKAQKLMNKLKTEEAVYRVLKDMITTEKKDN